MSDESEIESATSTSPAAASVVIPAHNEEAVIDRLLDALIDERRPPLEILVVCNGCVDGTAAAARRHGSWVRVIELDEPSKRVALERGDAEATAFPRLYVDADVELSYRDVELLIAAIRDLGVHAAAPTRRIPRDGVGPLVRWYYDVWEQLPQVRAGLFGRGVVAVSEVGNSRVRDLPAMMGDDLIASEAFAPDERHVVGDAYVVVHPPRTYRDLQRRRVRAATGNAQADQAGLRRSPSITTPKTLLTLAAEQPRLIPRIPVFVASAATSRWAARRSVRSGDFDTWLRDESSRQSR